MSKIVFKRLFIGLIIVSSLTNAAFAQTTAFSYQGRLTDMGSPANGIYILQFRLFDAATGGTQVGSTLMDITVTATNGVFNTPLDFGATAFGGADRFLEISVKKLPADPYTLLTPRQQILSAPYAIKSKTADNSTQLGGLNASRYVQQDAGGNVSIGGNLTVSGAVSYNIVNAQTQFNLGGQRILSGNNIALNLFVGSGAGTANTTGSDNTFVGVFTGELNMTGQQNAFFGSGAGRSSNTSGNSFFGFGSGGNTTSGFSNSFFGSGTGANNVTGSNNSFFGIFAGINNTASENSFFGARSGDGNTTGTQNSFFGFRTGFANTNASGNSFFGYRAGQMANGSDNSFFGNFAGAATTNGVNNSFFGSAAGASNTTGTDNNFFGLFAGRSNIDGIGNSFFGTSAGFLTTSGSENAFFGNFAGWNLTVGNTTGSRNTFVGNLSGNGITTGSSNTMLGYNTTGAANISFATAIGAGASVSTNNTLVLGRNLDTVQIPGNLNIAGNLTGGNIVKNLNGLSGNITLAAGANITITPAGNTLTIASTGGGGGILNQTTLQTGANFNIDGTGRANIFNANAQYNLGGNRVLSATSESGTANLFAGFSAGMSTTGFFNAFVGTFAGQNNTTGGNNSYFGVNAGGGEGSTGNENTFIGNGAGFADGDGNRLTYIGVNTSNAPGFNLTNATAIGANARVTQNNSLVLGGITGVNGGTDTSVGIGTTAPKARLEVKNGNILVGSPGQGIILKSPDGATCRLLSIDNAGAMVLSAVTCP